MYICYNTVETRTIRMKKLIYISGLFLFLLAINACEKEIIEVVNDDATNTNVNSTRFINPGDDTSGNIGGIVDVDDKDDDVEEDNDKIVDPDDEDDDVEEDNNTHHEGK
jgi:hypothetical protein